MLLRAGLSRLVPEVLTDFHLFSQLKPNLQKSAICFSGFDDLQRSNWIGSVITGKGLLNPVRCITLFG